jgi:hypothetical protein
MNLNTIFKLKAIEYWDKKPKYPRFEVSVHTVSYFSSLDKAEQTMKNFNEEDFAQKPVFGFKIEEYVLDEYSYWAEPKSWRTYLSDGSLWDESIKPSMWYENGEPWKEYFAGRPAEKIRFKIGDLVEVLFSDNHVSLLKVDNLPHTPEKAEQYIERMLKNHPNISGLIPDVFEPNDMYYVVDEFGGHYHPTPCMVFPARFKISKKLQEKLSKAQPL